MHSLCLTIIINIIIFYDAVLSHCCDEFLEDYNSIYTPMPLVLFMNAVEHVVRINRVINQARGHALLVGVGGSGRKSLTKLAVHVAGMNVFEIVIKRTYRIEDWRDDIRKMLRLAGELGRQTVFLFADTQIINETFVEDISSLLNTGEVPNLFAKDELTEIFETLAKAAKLERVDLPTPDATVAYFVRRCRANLHIVLAFSPIGDDFRRRLMMFPALVNCCTIDWFTAWPSEVIYCFFRLF